ncbi:MAG: hypothetical protein IJ946_03680 [Clostridia bacterium]|nr:hypothetical protein [Clostridia bacterium]
MAVFTNVATLTYNGNTTNSNVVTGEILEVLSANKTALNDTYGANDNITYVINIINSGSSAVENLTVTDNLGVYSVDEQSFVPLALVDGSVRYFVNGILQATPTVLAGPPLTVSGINIPANSNAYIAYEAVTTPFAPLGEGATITNQAVINGVGLTDVTVSETVTSRNEALLTVTKALAPTVVLENGEITYTFTIQNFGSAPAVATDDVVLSDTFNPALTITSVTFNGQAFAEGTDYTYNPATGEFTTLAGRITVPAATFVRNDDGTYSVTPGVSTLTVVGTV